MARARSSVVLASALAAAALAACVAYAPTLSFAPSWDDRFLTTENPFLASPRGILRLLSTDIWRASAKREPSEFYRPLAMLSYAVSRLVTGASAASFRAGNVALHATNVVLMGLLAFRSLGAPGASGDAGRDRDADPDRETERAALVAATLAASWLALSPLHVEAVVWLAGRFDLLGTTCALGAFLANGPSGRPRRALTVTLTAAAVLCKEAFITVPVLIALQDALVARRPLRPEAWKHGAIGMLVGAFLGVRMVVGVKTGSAATALGAPVLLQSYAFVLATYARLAVAPTELDPLRMYEPLGLLPTTLVLAGAALAFTLVGARLLPRFDKGTALGRPSRLLDAGLFGLALFGLVLGPVAMTGPTLGIVGDRYGYFPSVGLGLAGAAAIVAGARAWWPRRDGPPWARAATLAAVTTSAVALFGYAAFRLEVRARDWVDERALFEASLARRPTNSHAQYYVGILDAQEGHEARARELLEAARAQRPTDFRILNALCFTYLRANDLARAERRCKESLASNASNVRTWTNLASTYLNARRFAEAETASTEALARKAEDPEARYVRAVARANLGDIAGAREDVSAVLTLAPSHPGALDLRAQLASRGLW